MKVRIKFTKTGPLKFIAHLDVMRYFQKLLRRADIPVSYSEGFSPHQILSFSHPLPLGMESMGEYADIELTEKITSKDALCALKRESVPNIEILSFKELPEGSENAMASLFASKYSIKFNERAAGESLSQIADKILSAEDITVFKKTKTSEKYENIRPFIYELTADEEANTLTVILSSGSVNNIKPSLLIDAIALFTQNELSKEEYSVTRLEQYTRLNGELISLDDVGKIIV